MTLAPHRRISGGLTVDNAGTEATGRARMTALVELSRLAGLGDRLSVRWLGTGAGMQHWRVGYEAYGPAPADGGPAHAGWLRLGPWRWGVAYSRTRYVLGGHFSPLDAHGTAGVWRLEARYPLVRSGRLSQDLSLSYDRKTLRDWMLGQETPALVQTLSATARWSWPNGLAVPAGRSRFGLTDAWVSLSPGSLEFRSEAAAADDAAGARAAGGFVVVKAGVTGRIALSPRTALLVTATGQWASKNLHRAEKFSLGGPDGVRAYPSEEISGDMGMLLRTEARWAPPVSAPWVRALELSAFVDVGSLTVSRRPWTGGSNHPTLAGAGVGVTYAPTDAATLQVEYAVPLRVDAGGPAAPGQLWLRLDVRL